MVQLDAYAPALRDAVIETLIIDRRAVRRPALRHGDADDERGVIGRVKARFPDLLFMAEAYWDMEWTLQEQGFELCYDKRLYDRLAHDSAD